MTISKPSLFSVIVLTALMLFHTSAAQSQQRIARTISPSMLIRVIGFQDIKPADLHTLKKLYESTGWNILQMDDDPSDGEMSVWGGRNMELALDEFVISGTGKPNNGIYIHMQDLGGFKVDNARIVFNDEQEETLFQNQLYRYGLRPIGSDEYEGEITLKSGQTVVVICTFGIESMNPNVRITIVR